MPIIENKWKRLFNTENMDFKQIYRRKISNIFEHKIAEFNYKLLHDIIACKHKLKTWKILNDDKCDICNESETAIHMLYECPYARSIWRLLENTINENINLWHVVTGHPTKCINFLISLTAYLIYKEALINRDQGRHRDMRTAGNFLFRYIVTLL